MEEKDNKAKSRRKHTKYKKRREKKKRQKKKNNVQAGGIQTSHRGDRQEMSDARDPFPLSISPKEERRSCCKWLEPNCLAGSRQLPFFFFFHVRPYIVHMEWLYMSVRQRLWYKFRAQILWTRLRSHSAAYYDSLLSVAPSLIWTEFTLPSTIDYFFVYFFSLSS